MSEEKLSGLINNLARLNNEMTAELVILNMHLRNGTNRTLSWREMSDRLRNHIAEEHCIKCDCIFYGVPDDNGKDICPYCGTIQLLCNLCTIAPDCESCPYDTSEVQDV